MPDRYQFPTTWKITSIFAASLYECSVNEVFQKEAEHFSIEMKLLADYKLKIKAVEGAFPFRWVKFASNIKLFFLLRSKSVAVQISVCKMWYFQWNRWRFEEAILKVVNSSENQLLSFNLKFDLSGIMKARNIHSKYWLHVPMHAVSPRFFFAGENRCVNFESLRCAYGINFISITVL